MRVVFHQDSIVERARFAFIGIDAQVDRAGVVFGQERPLQSGRKPRAATASQARGLHQLHHIGRLFFGKQSLEWCITASGQIAGQRVAVGHANGFEENRLEVFHRLFQSAVTRDRTSRRKAAAVSGVRFL